MTHATLGSWYVGHKLAAEAAEERSRRYCAEGRLPRVYIYFARLFGSAGEVSDLRYSYHGLKKDELADALDAHLKRHKPGSNLRDYPPLQSFYVSKSESVFQPSRLQHVIQDALPESVENAIKSVQRRGRPSMKPKQESGSDSLYVSDQLLGRCVCGLD